MSGDMWETPDELFDKVNSEFCFTFDLCANEQNTKCVEWSDDVEKTQNKIAINGSDHRCYWMNPPYSRGNIEKCMKAAYEISTQDKVVVALVRFDPSANWFKKWVDGKAREVRMLDKRVKFKGAEDSYNFPCCLVIYDPMGVFTPALPTDYYLWGWK